MSTFTFSSAADIWPVGTVVYVYVPGTSVAGTAGTYVASATVAQDGSVSFTGLTPQTQYVATDGLHSRRFRTGDEDEDDESPALDPNTVYVASDPDTLCDDDFNNGPSGWVPLMSATDQGGPLALDSEITTHGSRYSLHLDCGRSEKDGESYWGNNVAIKRLRRPQTVQKIYQRWEWAHQTEYKYDSPRMILFGLDTADKDANRVFYQVRWQHWLWTTSPGLQIDRYQYRAYDSVPAGQAATLDDWVDITVNGTPVSGVHPPNENKSNLQLTEVVWDLANHRLDGLRINGVGYGSLAPVPNQDLVGHEFYVGSLPTFEFGCNPIFGVYNSNGNATTHAQAYLARQTTRVLA